LIEIGRRHTRARLRATTILPRMTDTTCKDSWKDA
jgi:hypothetical protein